MAHDWRAGRCESLLRPPVDTVPRGRPAGCPRFSLFSLACACGAPGKCDLPGTATSVLPEREGADGCCGAAVMDSLGPRLCSAVQPFLREKLNLQHFRRLICSGFPFPQCQLPLSRTRRDLAAKREMLRGQFSPFKTLQEKCFQHCYITQVLRRFAVIPFQRA